MVSVSYAYYLFSIDQESNNIAKSSCFKLSFEDKNDINLLSVVPINEDEAVSLVPYEFTIKNVCKLAANYDVNIEELNSSTLNDSFVRYKLDNNESELLGYQDGSENIVNKDAGISRTIDSAILLPGEERTYNLRLWLDEDSTIEAADKLFSSKVVVTAALNKNPFVDVTFEPNGGQIEHSVITYVDGRTYNNLPIPYKKGYIFLGWYKTSELIDGDGIGNDSIADSSITKLYAKYIKGTYKLSIDPDGGEYNNSPGIYETNILYNDTFELQDATKKGYTFKNWSIEYGEETSINNNIVTMGLEDSYIKANYDINKYKLSIKLNGGTWNSNTLDQEYELEYNSTKEISNPVREGYTFTGWSVSSGELANTTFTIGDSDAVLSANWQINDYKWIVYHNKQNASGSGYTLSETENGHGNYGTTFKGTLKNYTGFTNPKQSEATIKEDVKYNQREKPTNNVLNYNYVRNKYSLVVKPNGGTFNSTTSNTTYSDIYYGAYKYIQNPIRIGYNFGGWTLVGANSSMVDSLYTMGSENSSLTANWKAKTYTVTLNNQSATTSGTQTITATYDAVLPKISVPTRVDYIFEGYYSGSGGTGTKYINADGTSARTWNIDNNTTLYAKWKSVYTDITFDIYGTDNAFQHLGYSLALKNKGDYFSTYNVKKDGKVVNSIAIPATYTYNNQKYRIVSIGSFHWTSVDTVEDLKSITIPNTVKVIKTIGLGNISNLSSITIPSSVTEIETSGFSGSGLTSIKIPGTVKKLGGGAFASCHNLKTIYIDSKDIDIGKDAFSGLPCGKSYSSTIYVRSSAMRDKLYSNRVTDKGMIGSTEKTDYFTIAEYVDDFYGGNKYCTQVSTNYNW